MKKENWLYAIIGFLIGVVTATLVLFISMYWQGDSNHRNMMHDKGYEQGFKKAEMHSDSMHEVMHSMTQNLKGKSGDDFDQAFLKEMIIHHEGAVDMAEQALSSSKREEVKNLAKNIIEAQKKEIDQMNQWQKDWFAK